MRLPLVALLAAIGLTSAGLLSADSMTGVTSSAGFNDTVDWGQLGVCNHSVASTFTATSAAGLTVAGSEATGNVVEDVDGGPGSICDPLEWDGNFAPGANLLWTGTNNNGPITLDFSSGVSGAGMQIGSDVLTQFTATISAYDGAALLGSFSENGVQNSKGDNSAIFIGIQDLTGANITSIQIGLALSDGTPDDFAIGDLSLMDSASAVPEPADVGFVSMLLLGGIGAARRRQISKR